MDKLNVSQIKEMLLYVADKIIESKPFLTEVDSKIGDGDHGIGMSIGFAKVKEQLFSKQINSINDVFSITGMSMINSMGGASGVIFGTMFMGGIKGLPPLEFLDLEVLTLIFEKSLQAIKERGKANVGDKTMVDALQPASESLRESVNNSLSLIQALKLAEESAQKGMENTKNYIARFGRAKSLMERAVGYQDAGATSVWIIIRSMREWVEQN